MNYFEKTLNSLRIFGDRHAFGLSLPTKENATKWLDRIENELSPENLTCDGELRGLALHNKHRELLAAQKHCHLLLAKDVAAAYADQFSIDEGAKDGMDVLSGILGMLGTPRRGRRRLQHPMIRQARRQRTFERENKLIAAVQDGFTIGARVLISNGVRGTIIKINRTRVKVKGEDQRLWSVPPRCMTLLKVR